MIYHYDLHIHSVLSPCADSLMTPNNIFNMAYLKGLDMISITDHNSLKQILVSYEISKSFDFLFIPGVEVTVKEGFDVLVYFKKIEDALLFDQVIEKYLENMNVDLSKYNEQIICDINDEINYIYPILLTQPLNLTYKEFIRILKPFERLVILAHIDRYIDKITPYIEMDLHDGLEFKKQKSDFKSSYLFNSDAHQITDILEKGLNNQIELEELSMDCLFRSIKNG